MKRILLTIISLAFYQLHIAQLTPVQTWAFPNPTPNPPNLTVNSYTRASQSIHLLPGFKYGFVSSQASNLLNLSISNYPYFVPSAYMGSAINPNNISCNSVPSINLNKPVGETAGNFQVSPSGAATYNIPIIMSPGTKGVQPALALSYNSQAGLGLLGVGWNLSGLSSIARSNKTPMHDGVFGGIDLSTNDVFSIDGNRLFASSGNYGSANTTYYCEAENFATITSLGSAGNGPEKFEVKDMNGNTLQYGYTADSRLTGIGNNSVLVWHLNKFTDEFGNYLTYTYKQLSGEVVIDRIDYTGNTAASLSPYNKITFNYIPLAEQNSSYISGAEFRQTQLLKEVCCWAGTTLFKKYVLEYQWNEGTYLTLVKEVDAGGNELNPTQFCWDNPNDFVGIQTNQNLNTNFVTNDYIDLTTIPADFNADGFSDFACFNPSSGRLRVYQNTFINNYGTNNSAIGFNKVFDNPNQVGTNEVVLSSNVCDENGDGKQEVFTVLSPFQYSANNVNYATQYSILKTSYDNNNNVTIAGLGTYNTNSPINLGVTPSQFMFNVEDYTGDGIKDILRIDNEKLYLTTNSNTYNYTIFTQIKCFARPFSFDGDGVSEYIVVEDQSTYIRIRVVKFTGSGFAFNTIFNINFPNNNITQKNLLTHITHGDINGDGIDDIVYLDEYNSAMYLMKGTGTGFTTAQQINSFSSLGPNNKFDISCIDVNADGKKDIVVNESNTSNNTTIYYSYLSFGDIILKGGQYIGNWKIGDATKIFYETTQEKRKTVTKEVEKSFNVNMGLDIHYGDFNGDGIYDYTNFAQGSDHIITNNVNGEVKKSIKIIFTPMRNNIEIRYANIGNRFSVNNGNKDEVLKPITSPGFSGGVGRMITNMYCVSHVFSTSGYSGQFQNTKRFIYSNPTYHLFGRGFLGFENIYSIDLSTNIGSQTTTSINPTYKIPIGYTQTSSKFVLSAVSGISNAWTYQPDLSKIIARTNSTITVIPRSTSAYFLQLTRTESTNYLSSTRQSSEFTYSMAANGNIESETTKLGWNLTSPVKTSISTYTYTSNNGIHKLWKQNVQSTQAGQSVYERNTEFVYDNQGHLNIKINDLNTAGLSGNILTTTYSNFNPFGAATKVTISAPDITTRDSEVNYDATGRFIIKKINAIGDFSEYTYEPLYGNVIEDKDITGHTTKYEYDDLGRLKKATAPTNVVSKKTYAWDNLANYPYSGQPMGAFSILTETDASPYSKAYYTGNGLVIRKESQDFAGNTVISDIEYNTTNSALPDGVALEATEPHYPGQVKYLKTTYDYETVFYRQTAAKTYSVNSGSATFTGYYSQTNFNSPSNLTTFNAPFIETENQLSQKVKKSFNSAGQVTLVVNSNLSDQQQASYTYHSTGQPNSIALSSVSTPNQNIVHSFTYNGLGQKIAMIDPSHGTVTYQYNTIGEVLQESNTSGIFNYTYDILGRLLTKAGNQSGTTTYQYNSSGNGKELVWKVTGPNSLTEFQYDGFNRLIQSKETIYQGNKTFSSNYSYDNYGREIQHTYPSGFITKNVYNNFGNLTSITDNNSQLIWQLKDVDAIGKIKEFDYGNGITTKNKFNDLNQLIEIEFGSLHKQNYTYDALSSNINFRRFRNFVNNTDLQEFFGIDNSDRLTQSALYDPVNNSYPLVNNVSYDVLGNISHKDDAGDYHYTNTNKPFTLTQMTNATNNISLNTLSVLHTDFDKVATISEMNTNKQMDFVYGNDNERLKVTYSIGGNNQYTRYYAENYDRQENTGGTYKEWTYIFAPSGLCAVYYNNNGTAQLNYVLTDHLGSPVILTGTVNNNPQTIVEQYSFDSWGRRRNPTNWTYNNIPTSYILIRGFTLHEHIEEFALINMNGRVYDPVLGRFIQPDNYIQSSGNLQNYNRYAYCLNNPLIYNDPSGNFWIQAAFGLMGAYAGGAFANNNANPLQWDYSDRRTWIGIGIGAVVGVGLGHLVANGVQLSVGTSVFGQHISFASMQVGAQATTFTFLGGITGLAGYSGIQHTVSRNRERQLKKQAAMDASQYSGYQNSDPRELSSVGNCLLITSQMESGISSIGGTTEQESSYILNLVGPDGSKNIDGTSNHIVNQNLLEGTSGYKVQITGIRLLGPDRGDGMRYVISYYDSQNNQIYPNFDAEVYKPREGDGLRRSSNPENVIIKNGYSIGDRPIFYNSSGGYVRIDVYRSLYDPKQGLYDRCLNVEIGYKLTRFYR
jgi:RHS repeat-associated protein